LLLGFGDNNRAVHVVCSPKDEYLAIITAYLPDPVSGRRILEGGNKYGMPTLQRSHGSQHGSI
jgi:hypothetical protein